ncbi:RNA polymerase sigma factor [Pedobacter sp. FW305-3-2-15-E-R2A2]|jgi:RNA polymerase sigma-70 factor (ECF subfamily)|uniref:RNA polymerase sigma factor n=1 Tax=Pedobacter sp. FW305-3-2-15-E-R2A2 TaxID=3140251 RepID=UPI00313FF698
MLDNSKEQQDFFTKIVKENQASIYRICRAYLYDVSYAEDLYQEILYQIWKSIKSFKGNSKASTWIYRIAVNTAIGFNLKNSRHEHQPILDSLQMPDIDSISEKEEQEKQLIDLRYSISQLAAQDRLIISLVLEKKSYKEIAEITGASMSNTGVRINRIKDRLLQLMNKKKHE